MTLFVRPLTENELHQLRAGQHAEHGFTRRRCQILLASTQGLSPTQIGLRLGCHYSTVREAIHSFNRRGLACLQQRLRAPGKAEVVVDVSKDGQLRQLLQTSPLKYGKAKQCWTLALLAEVCCEQGLAAREVTREGMRQAIERMGIQWQQAKRWVSTAERPPVFHGR
jgi:transposase